MSAWLSQGGGVAVIFHSSLLINPRPTVSLPLNLSGPNWKSKKPALFVIVNSSSVLHSELLTEFSECDLVFSANKVIIVGDFNINVDVNNNCLRTAFSARLHWFYPKCK